MTIPEAIQHLTNIENRLRGGLSNDLAAAGADLCADIANRVINDGESESGGLFTPYSTKEVPAFWYIGRSRNSAADARVRAIARQRGALSYRDFRGLNNLPTSPKNFSFTNEMWRGFGVKKAVYQNGQYILTIGGKTSASADKIAWMAGQEGRSIIAPNDEELNRIARTLTQKALERGR